MKKNSIDPTINLEDRLDIKYDECKTLLLNYLEEYLILFDDGLKIAIKIHELCEFNQHKIKKGLSFVVLSSKIVGLLIGIRGLLFSGLPDNVKILNRSLFETIDIFNACLINKELSDSYSRTDCFYNNDEFYWKHFSKGKLQKECNKLFLKINISEEYIRKMNDIRNNEHSFYSNSVHASFQSSMALYIMPTIDMKFTMDYFGRVTTAYPNILMKLIEEIYLFSEVFFNVLDKKVSIDFKDLKPNEIDPLYFHYYNKYKVLYTENWKRLFINVPKYAQNI